MFGFAEVVDAVRGAGFLPDNVDERRGEFRVLVDGFAPVWFWQEMPDAWTVDCEVEGYEVCWTAGASDGLVPDLVVWARDAVREWAAEAV
jgi:hypothetical protein